MVDTIIEAGRYIESVITMIDEKTPIKVSEFELKEICILLPTCIVQVHNMPTASTWKSKAIQALRDAIDHFSIAYNMVRFQTSTYSKVQFIETIRSGQNGLEHLLEMIERELKKHEEHVEC